MAENNGTFSTGDLGRQAAKKPRTNNNYGLKLYYQPIVEPIFSKTVAYEGLLRLLDKSLKFVSPAVFVPIAEKNGLDVALGNWVIDEACRTINKLDKKEMKIQYISTNVSTKHFMRKDYINDLNKILKKHDVTPDRICLEIAEFAMVSKSRVTMQKMDELKDMGFKIAIDGFGGEAGSLSKLNNIPADIIKLDKQYVDRIMIDPNTRKITESIVSLAKNLGLEVIATAVEDASQQQALMQMGCTQMQGFLYGEPVRERDILYPPKKKQEEYIIQTDADEEE